MSFQKTYVLGEQFLNQDITVERGVKQGCPLSARLFILTLEPPLQMLRDNKRFKRMQKVELSKKKVAYADDKTIIAANNDDIAEAIKTVNQFCDGTQFQLDEDKTERFNLFEKRIEQRLKLLGLYIQNEKSCGTECYKQMLEKEVQKASRICKTTMSMKVKNDDLKNFSVPSIVLLAQTTSYDRVK